MAKRRLIFRLHAVERMFERGIDADAVRVVLSEGTMIEEYPDDTPYPSFLALGEVGGRPIHVVAAFNEADGATIVITVYEPDPAKWDDGFQTRRPS